jgi:hypothetical protein
MPPLLVASAEVSVLWFFLFSLLGMFLVPAAAGRAAWMFPAGFAGLAAFLLLTPPALHPFLNPWVFTLLAMGMWVPFTVDLLARGRVARVLDAVPLRALVALALFRFMGLRHAQAALSGDLPPDIALATATGELFTATGALFLWAIWRPAGAWHRVLLVLWNTWGLLTALALAFRIFRSAPGLSFLPLAEPSFAVHGYFTQWPGALEAFFWIPLAICLHLAVFYRIHRQAARGPILYGR